MFATITAAARENRRTWRDVTSGEDEADVMVLGLVLVCRNVVKRTWLLKAGTAPLFGESIGQAG